MTARRFRDRAEAAGQLAEALSPYRGLDPVVLAIPRGGVPMGRVIADALGGELDVALVRKLGAPGNPELAIGAVDERGRLFVDDIAEHVGATAAYVRREAARQSATLGERRALYTHGQPSPSVTGRVAIVVDDGLATGATMASALRLVRARSPRRLVCAVPVGSLSALRRIDKLADDVVCLSAPDPFICVGAHYVHFPPVEDAEVVEALRAREGAQQVRIPAGTVELSGELTVPDQPRGLVVFVHGSGSSRLSSRNRRVAAVLNRDGFATLLFDLLTEAEDLRREARFDIPRLAVRLDYALDWVASQPRVAGLALGLFGASTGSAVALTAAAGQRHPVAAVVSRGGRPDLAGEHMLGRVHAPTLLIVGGADTDVLALNRAAARFIPAPTKLAVVPGASHLFEEPGTLEEAADRATEWFSRHLAFDAAATHRVATSTAATGPSTPPPSQH